MEFGEKLQWALDKENMTQVELAKRLNLKGPTVNRYVKENRQPDIETIKRIALILNVSVDFLLGLDNEKVDNQTKQKELTKRDIREIEEVMRQMKDQLLSAEGLMLSGEPASPEAVQSILDSMQIGMELAKRKNKEKYTPKKYRKG